MLYRPVGIVRKHYKLAVALYRNRIRSAHPSLWGVAVCCQMLTNVKRIKRPALPLGQHLSLALKK